MKVSIPNLRTELLLTLVFLLIIGMGLISIVTLKITGEGLIRHQKNLGLSAVQCLQKAVDDSRINLTDPAGHNRLKKYLSEQIREMSSSRIFKKIEVIGRDLTVWASTADVPLLRQTMVTRLSSLFQSQKLQSLIIQDTLSVTAPLFLGADCVAAAHIEVSIGTIRQTMGKLHTMILFYIILNIVILLIIGNFFLSRIVIKPIGRLVKLTDQFEETEIFTLATRLGRQNEITKLAVALNRMLKRLGENKRLLEAQVDSLKKANQELRMAREEVIRSERLASLGRLATGVAHEIGNPIGAVLGYTKILIEEIKGDESSKDYLKRIEQEVMRIDNIVRELLDFARPSYSESVRVDLNLIVTETMAFFSHQKIVRQIELVSELADKPLMVLVDYNKIKQVLINLILNAYDAMMEKQAMINKEKKSCASILTIRTEKISSDHPTLHSRKEKTGDDCALLTVSDTGTGISKSDVEKIFDPFYTTKSPGKGTGLGLAISLKIIESFNGNIYVETTQGQGSTFVVTLPLTDESIGTINS